MKRFILTILLAAMSAACVCGCGKASEPSAAASAAEGGTSAPENTAASAAEETTMNQTIRPTQKEIICEHDGGSIYGIAYIPDEHHRAPLVILSHGLGANHQSVEDYAERFAEHGYAAYIFDFPNGSAPQLENKSGTETTKMSVMTEAAALSSVLDAAKGWDFADPAQIWLFGESQGGLVSSVVACDRSSEIAGMLLFYPAFNIPYDVRKNYESLDDVPETYSLLGWLNVGKIYAADVWELDIFSKLANYHGKTLIVHGDLDSLVDISYSTRADEALSDCELHVIKGADHGFHGDDRETAARYLTEFLDTYAKRER